MIITVEDDISIREIIVYTLNSVGFKAVGVSSASELFEWIKADKPELILLDIMLPDMDGVEILRTLRCDKSTFDIPIIMASAKSSEYDKVESLELGADDYLVKPFGMMEMVSRVKAVLRRSTPKKESEILEVESIKIDLNAHKVYVDKSEVSLTLKEFDLLVLMAQYPGIVFSRERLLNTVWEQSSLAETRTVDNHIKTLRQKLGQGGELIETIRGIGYRVRNNE